MNLKTLKSETTETLYKEFVESGKYEAGGKLPSIRELEKSFSTSRGSIEQALNALEARGIIFKRPGIGSYLANYIENKDQSPKQLGLVTHFGYEVMMHVAEGVHSYASRNGYNTSYASSTASYEDEREQVKHLVDTGCQAIIITPAIRTRQQLKNDYLKTEFRDAAIALIDCAFPEQGRIQVVFDNHKAGYDMTRMLIADGHKRIAFIDVNQHDMNACVFSTSQRYKGYCDALRDAGIEYNPEDYWLSIADRIDYPKREDILPFLHRWIGQSEKPTAVISLEDTTAINLITLAQGMGISVPDDLTVVGFDNLNAAKFFHPSFPTSNPSFYRAGELAAQLAIDQANGEQIEPRIYVLECPIKLRHWELPELVSREL